MNLMGVDIGTTGCKATIFDPQGNMLASSYREYDIIRDQDGRAELDSNEVWFQICQVIAFCTSQADGASIAALSMTSMGEALVPIDRNGRICGNSVLGCDSRGDKYLERFTSAVGFDEIYRITGQPAGLGYSLPALCRIMEEDAELYSKTVKFIPWADFVTYMLTGKIQANYSLAARTLLFDLEKRCWSKQLVDAIGFDLNKLPSLVPTGRIVGQILPEMSKKLGLPDNLQIISGSHDQCAAAVGSGACETGSAMLGLGTYACMVVVHDFIEPESPFKRLGLNIEPHVIPEQYVSFIYHGSGGALLKWLRDEMFRDLSGEQVYQQMDEEASASENPAILLPYFAETGPLDYVPGGRGLIGGLSFNHTRGDILKGAMAGIIFYFKDALEQLNKNCYPISKLYITGGGTQSKIWLQMIADILDIPILKTSVNECGTLGAAIIAGSGHGVFKDFDNAVAQMINPAIKLDPVVESKIIYADQYEKYIQNKINLNECNFFML